MQALNALSRSYIQAASSFYLHNALHLETLSMEETCPLLAKPTGAAQCVEGYESDETVANPTRKTFALWQAGALCGKHLIVYFILLYCDLTDLLGILLAFADTSLVWATHETIASRFGNLQNSSWMMTSFTIGYCVTLPLVSAPDGSLNFESMHTKQLDSMEG